MKHKHLLLTAFNMKHRQSFYFSVLLLVVTLCGAGKTSFGQYVQINDPRYVFPNFSRTTGIVCFQSQGVWLPMYQEGIQGYQPDFIIQSFGISTEHIFGVGCGLRPAEGYSIKDGFPLWVYLIKLKQDNHTLEIVDSALIDFSQTPQLTDFQLYDTMYNVWRDERVPFYEGYFSKEHVLSDTLIVGTRLHPGDDGNYPEGVYILDGCKDFGEASPHDHVYWWNPCCPEIVSFEPILIFSDAIGPLYPIRATACPQVQVHVDSTTSTQVFLSWPAANLASRYRVEYGPAGFVFSTGTHIDDIHDTNYCLSGLLPGVLYDVYVSAYCDSVRQYAVPDSVRVMPEDAFTCPAVEDFRLGGSYDYTVWFDWDSTFLQSDYQISLGPAQNSPDSNHLTNTYQNPTYISTGLEAGVRYAAYIRAQCPHQCAVHDTTIWSPWSNPICFVLDSNGRVVTDTSGQEGIHTQAERGPQFVITPNPAKDKVVVTLLPPTNPSDCTLTLADAGGREMLRFARPEAQLQIDLTPLPAGLYLVTLTTPQGSSTQKLVVE